MCMTIEIERKFLVGGAFKSLVSNSFVIAQGFLNTDPQRTVRIRIKGEKGFITVKGKSNEAGTMRFEWEKEIAVEEAMSLLALCEPTMIKKTRYIIPADNDLFFEVDEFHEDNEGLIIAEIELPSEDFEFEKPDWLGEEVTGDVRYYNSMLSKKPYCKW